MFWACEEMSTQFWRDDLLVQSVCELLIEMMKWVKSKFCVNYFISGNNMMDHLVNTHLSYEINALWKTSPSVEHISEILNTSKVCELENVVYHIESSAWMKRAFVIYYRVYNVINNNTDLFCTCLTTDLQNALYLELSV